MGWLIEEDRLSYHGNYDCTAGVVEQDGREWVAEVAEDEVPEHYPTFREVGRYGTLLDALRAADAAIPDLHRYDDD